MFKNNITLTKRDRFLHLLQSEVKKHQIMAADYVSPVDYSDEALQVYVDREVLEIEVLRRIFALLNIDVVALCLELFASTDFLLCPPPKGTGELENVINLNDTEGWHLGQVFREEALSGAVETSITMMPVNLEHIAASYLVDGDLRFANIGKNTLSCKVSSTRLRDYFQH